MLQHWVHLYTIIYTTLPRAWHTLRGLSWEKRLTLAGRGHGALFGVSSSALELQRLEAHSTSPVKSWVGHKLVAIRVLQLLHYLPVGEWQLRSFLDVHFIKINFTSFPINGKGRGNTHTLAVVLILLYLYTCSTKKMYLSEDMREGSPKLMHERWVYL